MGPFTSPTTMELKPITPIAAAATPRNFFSLTLRGRGGQPRFAQSTQPSKALTRPPAALTLATDALATLAALPPPQCFDLQCQSSKDAIFAVSLIAPIIAFAAAAAIALRPPPPAGSSRFDDPDTGAVFQAPKGAPEPARDRYGELAFRAVSWTPLPVEAGDQGEALRIEVGPVGATQPRTFLFDRVLPQPSRLVAVRLPRPLGVVIEEDRSTKRAVVAEIIEGGNADQRRKKASLDPGLAATAVQPGDVLRAITATNLVYRNGAAMLFGAQPPERTVVVFGADGQRWPKVAEALKRGLLADGDVTMVLERRVVAAEEEKVERKKSGEYEFDSSLFTSDSRKQSEKK